ncbi:MAG: D-alanine--D-alanine ligase [Oligoflexia bacterium]|nr:D-alanine--D-alanine ligase [Oligoflexia bacterium]
MGMKIRVAVLYGGKSGEHEVSLRSAASVIRHLDSKRYEVIPIAVDKAGRWSLTELSEKDRAAESLPVRSNGPEFVLPLSGAARPVDVVFPVIHGTFGEDGTLQGLLELADLPYVGCGVLASAVGMDKEVAKRLIQGAGLPIVPYLALRKDAYARDKVAAQVGEKLGYPCFVKPANAGSSVGVHKVKDPSQLLAALDDSFRYDTKVLVEKAIAAREVELSVLENPDPAGEPLVSVPGEITPSHEFYSYEAKYLDEKGAALLIPAKLTAEQTQRAQDIARRAFRALEGEGMARVDLFVDRVSGDFYFNEVNTIPGFTSISMYPKMWEASGLGYSELLTRLVELALARHKRKAELVREFHV